MNQGKGRPKPVVGGGVSKKLRAQILQRDQFTCQTCGAVEGNFDPAFPSKTVGLTIGYISETPKGRRRNVAENLRVECTNCNEGFQRLREDGTSLPKPNLIELLTQIRGATIHDQRSVYKKLRTKFGAGCE